MCRSIAVGKIYFVNHLVDVLMENAISWVISRPNQMLHEFYYVRYWTGTKQSTKSIFKFSEFGDGFLYSNIFGLY